MKGPIIAFKKQNPYDHILSITIGLVYIWFGTLKFFPGLSPAEELAKNTISSLTLGILTPDISILLLAIIETMIGLMLILNLYRKVVIVGALAHMVCTFTPFLFFPEITFTKPPFYPTLLGQYIAKNIIIMGALVVLYKNRDQ